MLIDYFRNTKVYTYFSYSYFRSSHEKELLIDGQKQPQIDTMITSNNGKNGVNTKREVVGSISKEDIV